MSTTNLAPISRCDRCGAELEAGARYCPNCGQEVEDASTPLEPSAQTYWRDADPASASMRPLSAAFDSGGGIGKLFSASGRIGRMEYFLTIAGVWLAVIVIWAISAFLDTPGLLLLLMLAAWLAATVVSVVAGIKRLHDFDQNGWLILLNAVPFAGFILQLVLLFKGSSPGLNTFGYADSGSVMG
jgi:uncharacterized membrane protein YhaH (DUF805 family)